MAKVKAKTTLNKRAIKAIEDAEYEALEKTLKGSRDSILGEIMAAEVVPKQTGELERSAHLDDSQKKKDRVTLTYDTPYARRLYYHPEYNFAKDKNRNAQGEWLEAWSADNIVKKVFKKLWKKFSKGYIK